MGHRHTPEEFGCESAVRSADGGFAAAAEERLISLSAEQTGGAPSGPGQTSPVPADANAHAGLRIALFALRFYKAYLSILFAGSCRFEPSCSRYAYEAIERFGVARGVWMGLKRLLRCHPLSRKFGHDPVPEKWEDMSSENHAAPLEEVRS